MKAHKRDIAAPEPTVEAWPHWGPALFAACVGSWLALFAAVRLLASLS